jgi:hypothetical protein
MMERAVFTYGRVARERLIESLAEFPLGWTWREVDFEPIAPQLHLATGSLTWDTVRFMRHLKRTL